MTKKLIVCDCLGSQSVNPAKLSQWAGVDCSSVLTDACGTQIDQTARVLKESEDVIVACRQQARLFTELAEEIGAAVPAFVDIRDRAGWTAQGEDPDPKMAALVAEALLAVPAHKTVDIESGGTCLVIGGSEAALNAARDLSENLAVTLLLPEASDVDVDAPFEIVAGRVARSLGSLGQFELRIDRFQQPRAGGRGAAEWQAPRDGAMSGCDIIVDLSGDRPLFPAPHKRDGYLHADPGSGPAVAKAVFAASQLVGTFEKTLYVRLEEPLCAHSRAEKPACSKCLDHCPTGAITSAGEHVAIDPLICAGCGACSALCPSGAISYDAPPVGTVFQRLHTLASTYRKAGGSAPRLLVHDEDFG
ncbi:MAG: 4Fe-4S binding protein, partial [Roseobacter sp.]